MSLTKEQIEQLMETNMSEDQIAMILGNGNEIKESAAIQVVKPAPEPPINYTETMSITSASDLQAYSNGTLVRFPDFAEGQPFVARVRRPSMLVLAKQGKIPNTLLSSANELFTKGGGGLDNDDSNMLADIYGIIEIICEAALKEPTYQQIKDAGLELSDDQLMAIFNYTQSGVKALESFR